MAQTLAPAPPASTLPGGPRVTQRHPCALWDDEDIAAYKRALRADPDLKAAFDQLRAWGDERITEPLNAKFMYTGHGRWGLVCLYGVLAAGVVLDDPALVDLTLYGLGGTKDNVTGGFMDCFKPACLRPGVIWAPEAEAQQQMASVAVLTTVAEVMWHRGIDLYAYQGKALKQPFDAALADTADGQIARLQSLPGISAYQYAFRRYQDARYLPLVRRLKPDLTLAISEHLPSLPAASSIASP